MVQSEQYSEQIDGRLGGGGGGARRLKLAWKKLTEKDYRDYREWELATKEDLEIRCEICYALS